MADGQVASKSALSDGLFIEEPCGLRRTGGRGSTVRSTIGGLNQRRFTVDRFTGGCLCGDVRIVATGRPYRVGLCHCLDCRKHHGALFYAAAVFPQDAVTVDG